MSLSTFLSTFFDDDASIMMRDGTQVGCYADNAARLRLSALTVNGDVSWGEPPADAALDRVNSVRLTNWVELVAGTVTGAVLHADHPSSRDGLIDVVGRWEFAADNPLSFSSVDVTFRYDDAYAATNGIDARELSVFLFDGARCALCRAASVTMLPRFNNC